MMQPEPEPYETHRRAAALNELLGRIGLSNGAGTEWWNHQTYEELGGRTPTDAWLNGDHEAVEHLVERWYLETEAAVADYVGDPKFMAALRQKQAARSKRSLRSA